MVEVKEWWLELDKPQGEKRWVKGYGSDEAAAHNNYINDHDPERRNIVNRILSLREKLLIDSGQGLTFEKYMECVDAERAAERKRERKK